MSRSYHRSSGDGKPKILVATGSEVLVVDPRRGKLHRADGPCERRPTCLATPQGTESSGPAWCGTDGGVLRSDDAGRTWRPAGLAGEHVTALAVGRGRPDVVWAGTEPSALFRSGDAGATWSAAGGLRQLPSSSEWSFPPKPETDHVRWIACHPRKPGHLWLAIEAGALVSTPDGGTTWHDRVAGGPRDTHELAIHPERPELLRIAAGDGYFESPDAGRTWRTPREGLDVGYLRSVAIDPADPDTGVVSASSRARTAYVAGHADGRLYRREGEGPWRRITAGWPERPETIAPLLVADTGRGALWAADERGVHRSEDGGRHWVRIAPFENRPSNLRGLAITAGSA